MLSCLLHLTGAQTGRADANTLGGAVDDGAHALQVDVPATVRDIVRVADAVPGHRFLATHGTDLSHRNLQRSERSKAIVYQHGILKRKRAGLFCLGSRFEPGPEAIV